MVESDPAGDLGSSSTSCGQPEVLQLRRLRKDKDRLEPILNSNWWAFRTGGVGCLYPELSALWDIPDSNPGPLLRKSGAQPISQHISKFFSYSLPRPIVQYLLLAVRSAASQTTLWGGLGPRFEPRTGGLEAGTLTTRPPHLLMNKNNPRIQIRIGKAVLPNSDWIISYPCMNQNIGWLGLMKRVRSPLACCPSSVVTW